MSEPSTSAALCVLDLETARVVGRFHVRRMMLRRKLRRAWHYFYVPRWDQTEKRRRVVRIADIRRRELERERIAWLMSQVHETDVALEFGCTLDEAAEAVKLLGSAGVTMSEADSGLRQVLTSSEWDALKTDDVPVPPMLPQQTLMR